MKVFITWSGETSKAVALALRDFIPKVVQSVEAFMSESDIQKGTRWATEISQRLDAADMGIICLTPGNLSEPWLLFEAGALSKKAKDSPGRVCTYLYGLKNSEVLQPLEMFQHTQASKEDTLRLMLEIRTASASNLTDDALKEIYDALWPGLETKFTSAPPTTKQVQRSDRDMIEEMLGLIREISKSQKQQHCNDNLLALLDAAFLRREVVPESIIQEWVLKAFNSADARQQAFSGILGAYINAQKLEKEKAAVKHVLKDVKTVADVLKAHEVPPPRAGSQSDEENNS
jgi:hypothetical protein